MADLGQVASTPSEVIDDRMDSGGEKTPEPRGVGARRYALVLILAFLLRVVWALLVPVVPESDPGAYERLAINLASGYGFSLEGSPDSARIFIPTAYFSVGAPALYAAAYGIFGQGGFAVVMVNLTVSLGTIALAMRLAYRWFGRLPATATGILMAVWPTYVMFTTVMSNDLLLMFFVTVLMAIWTQKNMGWWPRSVLGGVALGAACLTSTSAVCLPIAMLAAAWVGREGWGKPVVAVLGAVLVTTAISLPWVMRNQERLNAFVLLTTDTGSKIWIGNHPDGDGQHVELPKKAMAMSEPYRNRRLWKDALGFIRDDPAQFLKRSAIKAVSVHDRETIGVTWNARGISNAWGNQAADEAATEGAGRQASKALRYLKLFCTAYWLAILTGTIAGLIVLAVKRGVGAAFFHPALFFWGYFAVYHAVMLVEDRHHLPVLPVFAIFAGLACAAVWSPLIGKKPLVLEPVGPVAAQ